MKKFVFYQIWVNNEYVRIHNRIFSHILSNPFFDDCIFFFSIVSGNKKLEKNRLIFPKKYFISEYENMGSEMPNLLEMVSRSEEYNFQKNDIIGYLHCKGTSFVPNRFSENPQNTEFSILSILEWIDELCFLLVNNIQDYTEYIHQYGTICSFSLRNIYPVTYGTGSTGNFWWASGDIISQVSKLNLNNIKKKNRHYFEQFFLKDLLVLSERKYKKSFYLTDGPVSFYYPHNDCIREVANSHYNKEFINLSNPDLPYISPEKASIGIWIKDINSINSFFEFATEFIKTQQFENFWIRPYLGQDNDDFTKDNIVNKQTKALIHIIMSENDLIENNTPVFLTMLASYFRNTYKMPLFNNTINENLLYLNKYKVYSYSMGE